MYFVKISTITINFRYKLIIYNTNLFVQIVYIKAFLVPLKIFSEKNKHCKINTLLAALRISKNGHTKC